MVTATKSYSDKHRLGLKLRPILVGELFLIKKPSQPVYIFEDGHFSEIIPVGGSATKELIAGLIRKGVREVYLYGEDISTIKKNLQSALIKVTRSLSVGDPLDNGAKDIKLLSLNMNGVYDNPHDDELLMLQFQSSLNLSKFLLENKKFLPYYFHSLTRENFHFTLTQPMQSSVLLLSFLQSTHLFHEREIESLFLTSYLKDIGFALIPDEKYDAKTLSEKDKQLFSQHADFSHGLLEGRVPLSKTHLTIIKNHHFLNDKLKNLVANNGVAEPVMVLGLESTLVAVFDILVAMINDRPYRKSISLYQALEVIRKMMADDYPQEFRALVVFLRNFFKN
jgi:hypothetical protein